MARLAELMKISQTLGVLDLSGSLQTDDQARELSSGVAASQRSHNAPSPTTPHTRMA